MIRTTEPERCVTSRDRRRLGSMLLDPACRALGDWNSRLALELALEEATPDKRSRGPFVRMHSRVSLVDLHSNEVKTATLMYPDELDLVPDGISVLEPLGAALLGCQPGDLLQCRDNQAWSHFRLAAILDESAIKENAPAPGSQPRCSSPRPAVTQQAAPCLPPRNAPGSERPPRMLRRALT